MTRPQKDWFRRTSWTLKDQEEFFARLARTRDKAQYLRIQAETLLDARSPFLAASAVSLLDRYLSDYPDDLFVSAVYRARAEAMLQLNQSDEAIASFRSSLEARRKMPNVGNDAHIAFAWTIARFGRRSLHDEALHVLREFHDPVELAFPVNAYRYFGTLAIIAEDGGDLAQAKHWAREALRAATTRKSGFTRHPDVGLLPPHHLDQESHARLRRLAA